MSAQPPLLARRILAALLPARERDDVLADLTELWEARAARSGRRVADRSYWRDLAGVVVRMRAANASGAWLHPYRSRARSARRPTMSTIVTDVRYAARSLARSPGFTAIAVVTLALGIGANTAIWSVVRTVLLRPLPFPSPERLVEISESRLDRGWPEVSFTHANFWDVRDLNRTFESVGAIRGATMSLTGVDRPERLAGAFVTADLFEALGVAPVAGRLFAEGEDEPGADPRLVVLSHDFWTSQFGGDSAVVGRRLVLDGEPHTVIGVLPRVRPWLDRAEVFVPLLRQADANRDSFELQVVGRLRAGVTMEAALADLERVANRLVEQYPEVNRGMGITLAPSSRWIADPTLRRALWILMGGVGLLLLVACANLANLMLARATDRSRERAVRAAFGASSRRLVLLALTESLLVGACGAALGSALAFGLVRLLRAFDPGEIPRLGDVAIDGPVLAFALGLALATSVLTGLVPALRLPQGIGSGLRDGERGIRGSRRQGRLRSILVTCEVAMSLVLLVGAALLLRSFAEVLQSERGFETENRMFFEVALSPAYGEPERANQFRTELLSRLTATEQVESAAAINVRPLVGVSVGMGFAAADQGRPGDEAVPWASWRLITPSYFRTLGVPIVAGRDFTEQDRIGDPWRVLVSHRVAEELWPGEHAIGRSIRLWAGQDGSEAEVIGVVADTLDWGLDDGASFAVYMPYNGIGGGAIDFVVHTSMSPTSFVPTIRSLLAEIDPNLPLSRIETMDEMIGADVASRRFLMFLLLGFSAIAVLLALAGVYGVLSYTVARRRSEIGLRIALGATRSSVRRLVVARGMRPVVVGLLLGIAGALALSRLMAGMLYGITPSDAPTYAAVAAVLALAAALSSLLPAHRAVRLELSSALRDE